MIESKELLKEGLDIAAFIFVTPEIIKNRIQEWADGWSGTTISKDNRIAIILLSLARELQKRKVLTDVSIFWIPVYFVIVAALMYYFGVFGMMDFTSMQSIILMLLGIVSFILVGFLGLILTVSISKFLIDHIFETGVSKIFLGIGIAAFLLARIIGVMAALDAPG